LKQKIYTKNNIFVVGFPTELDQAIVNILTNSKDALIEKNINNKSIKLTLVNITIEDNKGGKYATMIRSYGPCLLTLRASRTSVLGNALGSTTVNEYLQYNDLCLIKEHNRRAFFLFSFSKTFCSLVFTLSLSFFELIS